MHRARFVLELIGTVINQSCFSKYSLGVVERRKIKQRDLTAKGYSRCQVINVQEMYITDVNNVR